MLQAVAFRLAAYETPLWATPNFSPGRYNAAGDGCTQYLSLHPMTPWGELLRNEDRRDRDQALLLRTPLWAVKILLEEDPFDVTFDTASDVGITAEDLVSDDHSACRALAQRFRQDAGGPRAFVAPSAALPGTRNLVLLDPFVALSYELSPVAPEDLPVAMVAQDGRCPDGLWNLVHYRGTPTIHPALDAWQSGEVFELVEPPVSFESLTI